MSNNKQNQIMPIGNFSIEEVETMRHTLAKDASPEQFTLFVRTAAAAGLNPFLNHIYCIVYGGKMSIQISVEGIMFLAKRVEGYQGMDTQLVHEHDVFKAKKAKDEQGRDVWEIVQHDIEFPRGKVVGCYSIAYREGFRPVTEFMEVDEVQHHLSGNNAANWKKYFNDFFKKTVAKRAAKRQYGIEVAEDDTPEAGGSIPAYQAPPERRDITAEAEQMSTEKQQQPEAAQQKEESALTAARQQMAEKFKELEITEKDKMGEYIAEHAKPKGQKPTLAEMKALLKIMDMHIEEKKAQEASVNNSDDDLLDDELADMIK